MNRRQTWLGALALALLVANCGGRAATSAAAAGNSGIGSTPGGELPTGGGTGPVGPEPSSPEDAGPDLPGSIAPATGCTGELNAVAALWGNPCPDSLCLATSRAAVSCTSATLGVSDAALWQCGTLWVVSLTLSPLRGKACYYSDVDNAGASSPLVGASAWDSKASYCNGSATCIGAGLVPNTCQEEGSKTRLCSRGIDTSSGEAGASGASNQPSAPDEPVATCHNRFSGMCEPCCPATPPDCTNQPDGYPGYSCTEGSAASPSSYCSCRCWGGQWSCGC